MLTTINRLYFNLTGAGTVCLLAVLIWLTACTTATTGHRLVRIDSDQALPALPVPVTNNAVALVHTKGGRWLLSFGGLGSGKQWNDTLAHTYVLAPNRRTWQRGTDMPAGEGRLAAVAVSLADHAYVFGGYTVAADHSEVSLPYVHRYDPLTDRYSRLTDMPVPVDDAVAVSYADRYVYLVSGWHDKGNVNLVQVYDTQEDTWKQATPYPGVPVFGHAGGIVDNRMLVCDGVRIRTHKLARREFVMENSCYLGIIDSTDPRSIDWRIVPPHPGAARYRMAAAGSRALAGVIFAGGSPNPYNYDGIGYNGVPSEPVAEIFLFDLTARHWHTLGSLATPSMDHRGLLIDDKMLITIGGMHTGQQLTPAVQSSEIRNR